LLTIDKPDVLLWSVKPSEEGIDEGLITRFWNMKNEPVHPVIKLYKPIKTAWKTTHIETNKKLLKPVKGTLPVDFKANQINTYRLFVDD
jgi:alpha-mannosidase